MNKNKLKAYAPQARRDFTAAVKARAALLGISNHGISPATRSGDVVIVEGREWPAKVGAQRDRLATKIGKEGYDAVMGRVAHTWFNRFAALRYMELHDYLGHGHRVLSNREGGLPEILAYAGEVDLPGLDKARVAELRLAGDRDGDLYRMLLVAQCNALSAAMPFLFERIDDESELLLPDNLLRTDSVSAKMVAAIEEADWAQVEIVGWLYQFYISEKKDEVMGTVVTSEDIPAATQLFTPNWIVKYLVQNSVGRLWLMANPTSALRTKWEYYVAPAEQDADVRASLDALVQDRISADGGSLNPETITVFDPACGSGHILVEAYDVLKDIYLERGYQPRAIPRLILEKNLFGLDIDDRAAQLAGFSLLIKARADDRRLLDNPPELNVLSLQESKGLNLDELAIHLQSFGIERWAVATLLNAFSLAKTVGALIQVSKELDAALPIMAKSLPAAMENGDVFARAAAQDLLPLIRQALLLSMRFDAVVTNPPYMGGKGMNPILKTFAKSTYPDAKSDLFAMFIERAFGWCKPTGINSMVTMQTWMFLSSFEKMREKLLSSRTVYSLVQIGYNSFPEMNSKVAQACAFSIGAEHVQKYVGSFVDLNSAPQSSDKKEVFLGRDSSICYNRCQDDFATIPGAPVAYWASNEFRDCFRNFSPIAEHADPRHGMSTSDNGRFLRFWFEVSRTSIGYSIESRERAAESNLKWFPYHKGGSFRKWYGNNDYVVNWQSDGEEIKHISNIKYPYLNGNLDFVLGGQKFFFKPGITWSSLTSGSLSVRSFDKGFIFDAKGQCLFPFDEADKGALLGFLNSKVADSFLKAVSPTLDFNSGKIALLPFAKPAEDSVSVLATRCVELSRLDWNEMETSWDFEVPSFVPTSRSASSIRSSWSGWAKEATSRIEELRELEEKNNRLFIDAYGLQAELSPKVPEEQITLVHADREADSKRLISYSIGCMMGRYSLDEPGLIYADAGNVGFNPERYTTFPADVDGIVPLTDELWFEDDAALRVTEFVRAVWGRETFEENMAWLGESLGAKNGETGEEAVRRYLSSVFYKDHLQTYKRRPIYWLFSSGKQKGFEALVYLHRCQEGTLARMRSEYVVPLLSKYLDRIEMLGRDAEAVGSAAARTKIQKKIDALRKKHHELVGFEEKLRHTADSRIRLDLDEGVKANYGKFGDLLAETKAVTGGAED